MYMVSSFCRSAQTSGSTIISLANGPIPFGGISSKGSSDVFVKPVHFGMAIDRDEMSAFFMERTFVKGRPLTEPERDWVIRDVARQTPATIKDRVAEISRYGNPWLLIAYLDQSAKKQILSAKKIRQLVLAFAMQSRDKSPDLVRAMKDRAIATDFTDAAKALFARIELRPFWKEMRRIIEGQERAKLTLRQLDELLSRKVDTIVIEPLHTKTLVVNALKYNGLHTVRELIDKTEEELLDIQNLGPKSIGKLKAYLAGKRLHLKGDYVDWCVLHERNGCS